MSKLIYKQRCVSPNKWDTPINNRRHVEYIATRPGAMKDLNTCNALFGKLKDMDSTEGVTNLKEFLNYIELKSKEKTCFYRATISLREEDAIRLGYLNRDKWKEMITEHIYKISEKMNLPSSSMEWVAAVHMEKGHPHLHLVYWDTEQGVRDFFVKPATAAEIRKHLLKEVFSEDFSILFKDKNEAKQAMSQKTKSFLEEDHPELADVIRSVSSSHNLPPVMFSKISDTKLLKLAEELYLLKSRLSRKGALKYSYMPEDIKKDINRIVMTMLDSSKDLSGAFNSYIKVNSKIAGMYTNDIDSLGKAEEKAEAEAIKMMGNKLLSSIKKINEKEWQAVKDSYKKQMAFNTILELFNTMSQKLGESEAKKTIMERNTDLSKQAKKELAKKKDNASGVDWER
jgi:hypothetical protein